MDSSISGVSLCASQIANLGIGWGPDMEARVRGL